ncbi:hypothetical protein HYALB_00007819 [Hymenoscyphus albidus]|uniref:L-serine ammonia-lyase n=1 Tax=Hymenoscyphus albidus TaxID=595503 RepID=A0A9N9LD49_9HELO|nr:hypothetical protein HYALB_00007819 [Hymenoscyphus albidus]
MGSHAEAPLPPTPQPWVQTPLYRSTPLSRYAGCNIFLKLETLQPSGSFKSRGIGNLMSRAIAVHPPNAPVHFYCSSGGNAGLACATAALSLHRPATIVVPTSTSQFMITKLRSMGAEVKQIGAHWVEADAFLREELLVKDLNGVYVPPFDHPDVWAGNATVMDEIEEQMHAYGGYDAVVCSVGGGGLFAGIMAGLENYGRLSRSSEPPKVLAVETEGAASFAHSLREGQLSRLGAINTIATSLGATQVASRAYEFAISYPETVKSVVFSDAEAAIASVCFGDDERVIVEAACGVSIAAAYNGTIRKVVGQGLTNEEYEKKNVVIVVCGGSNVTLGVLENYIETYGNDEKVLKGFGKRWRGDL